MKYTNLLVLLLIMLLLSACSSAPVTETVIIPDTNPSPVDHASSKPIHVKKIYRLPDRFSNVGRILGWSADHAVIATFNSSQKVSLQQLPYPYEKSKDIGTIDRASYDTFLAPDGKTICEISSSTNQTVVQLVSLADGKKTVLNKWDDATSYIQNISWSANSKYISYLVNESSNQNPNTLHIYNMSTGTDSSYPLRVFQATEGDVVIHVDIANNGTSVLLQSYQGKRQQKKLVTMVEVSGKTLEVQYEREIGGNDVSWMNNDQFVFPGVDGSLYEYDRRNGELSVILDHVLNFSFSNDRKSIAYTSLQDQNVIYVGKIQGRNVLHQEPVYRGITAYLLMWNEDGKSLLIQGAKPWDATQSSSTTNYSEEALIVALE
ncbi:hypothetical protein [Paenibacillus wenxiniae]|uniref:WD40 repeat domain-containing protein n=1 Tax=Paenibacillus wenxiniae TaxID=1636843 RepID=A0ABW4RQ73_9BACL